MADLPLGRWLLAPPISGLVREHGLFALDDEDGAIEAVFLTMSNGILFGLQS